jgi:hypothetical protein
MPSSEFVGWIEYQRAHPLNEQAERLNFLIASLISLTANINRTQDAPPFSPFDFMPWMEKPKELETPQTDRMLEGKNKLKQQLASLQNA